MAKLFSKDFTKMFGEAFITDIQNRRKLQQDQEQFRMSLDFSNRQLDLREGFRRDQEARMQNQFEANLLQSFTPTESTVGSYLGKQLNEIANVNIFESDKRYTSLTPQRKSDTLYETVADNVINPENRKRSIKLRNKEDGTEFFMEKWVNPNEGNQNTKEKDISGMITKAEQLLKLAQINEKNKENLWKGYGSEDGSYELWKSDAEGIMAGMLNKAGLNERSPMVTELRMILPSDKDIQKDLDKINKRRDKDNQMTQGEYKRLLMNEKLYSKDFTEQYPRTQQQEEALKYYIQLGTR